MSKRNSHNDIPNGASITKNEYINRLAEQLMGKTTGNTL